MGRHLTRPLAYARLAVGVGAWLAPRAGLTVARFDPGAPESPYLLRLFAAREAALGMATLASSGRHEPLLALGLVVDSLDAVAGTMAQRSRSAGKAAAILTVVAAGGLVIGAMASARGPVTRR
jgi:hypothetical protein